jgi:hypothetical protein
MGINAEPMQVLIVLTARVGDRLKYQSIAYALVLKHVGVVLQTMYLSATAMRLAPRAVGTGILTNSRGCPESTTTRSPL